MIDRSKCLGRYISDSVQGLWTQVSCDSKYREEWSMMAIGSNRNSNDRAAASSQDRRLGIKSFRRKIGSFDLNFSEMPLKQSRWCQVGAVSPALRGGSELRTWTWEPSASGSSGCGWAHPGETTEKEKGLRHEGVTQSFKGWVEENKGFPDGSVVQNLPAMQETQETWVWSLGQKDPQEREMATRSSILAWKILWTEEPGRLQSVGSQESDMT